VLSFERQLNETFPSDQKYSYEVRGQAQLKVYSEDYTNAYHQMLNGQVERRMKSAVITIGSLWYTAWVDAGQPDLSKFYNVKDIIALSDEELSPNKPDSLRVRDHE
jgi:protein tyrosine phosphatase